MAGPAKLPLLIVEDDDGLRPALEKSFGRRAFLVSSAPTVAEGLRLVREKAIAVILLDLQLPDGSGMEVLTAARDLDPETVVVVMTAYPEVKTAVRAMREGASDFVIKPFDLQELHLSVQRAVEIRSLRRRVRRHQHERQQRDEITEIRGESPEIEEVRAQIRQVAGTDAPVLIVGETGTGKELVADAVHRGSERASNPLVKVNCSSFSENLLESELFGHEKGAFTDAREARAGLFEMADGGTLLLDEVSELKIQLQTKLLRVVEGHPFRRLGGEREIRTDVRVMSASNQDLPSRIEAGEFREDLFFRLNVFQIVVPPLRARGEDVVRLARFFLDRSAARLRRNPQRLSPEAAALLNAYPWPGNVRELRNVMERAVIVSDGETLGVEHLPRELHAAAFVRGQISGDGGALPSLGEIERRYVRHVYELEEGNISRSARVLGISRNTLKSKLGRTRSPASDLSE